MKRSRTAILLVLATAGSGAAGYLLGRGKDAASEVPRRAPHERVALEPARAPWGDFGEVAEPPPPPPAAPSLPPDEEAAAPEPVDPAGLFDALARDPASPYAQKMLDVLVAQAATNPRAALPKLRELLASGVDVAVTSFREDGTGYPTFRVALLDALAATGDPAAIEALAEVARSSASPIEVIFSAHLLDQLEGMDPATARFALQALAREFSPAERKALAPVLRQVAPAAARADPAFAEAVLSDRLRLPGDVRSLVPALDGLPEARARQVVLEALAAPDVPERSKSAVAVHAAAARAAETVAEVRRAVEHGALSANAVAAAARAAVYAPAFERMRNEARRAARSGDLARAERLADEMQRRLLEARALVAAGRARGARLPVELDKRGSIVEDWLQAARALAARERARLATPR